jgi:hypothetical protein
MVAVAVLLLAAPASAHDTKSHAKVFKAKLSGDDARGRAQLVDGRKHDKVSLHVKGLEPGETYVWAITQEGGEPDFTYGTLKVRPSGNANAKARSTTFKASDGDFSVEVQLEDGTVVASGDFERAGHGRRGENDRGHGKGHDKPGDD